MQIVKMFILLYADTSTGILAFGIFHWRDAEEEAEFRAKMREQANAPDDLPPQLLFVHQVVLSHMLEQRFIFSNYLMMLYSSLCCSNIADPKPG
jgi:hypothetical protein